MLSSVMRGLSVRAAGSRRLLGGGAKAGTETRRERPKRPKAALLPCANRGSATGRSRRVEHCCFEAKSERVGGCCTHARLGRQGSVRASVGVAPAFGSKQGAHPPHAER